MHATLSFEDTKRVSRVEARLHGSGVADPKLFDPLVAHKHSSLRREMCSLATWRPLLPSRTPSCLLLYSLAALEEPGMRPPHAGQIVPTSLFGGSRARMRERFVHVDTIEAAGPADPSVQTGIEGAVVRLVGALVAQWPLAFHRGRAVCTICHSDAVAVLAGRLQPLMRGSRAARWALPGAVANGPTLALHPGRKGGHCVRIVAEVGRDLVGQGVQTDAPGRCGIHCVRSVFLVAGDPVYLNVTLLGGRTDGSPDTAGHRAVACSEAAEALRDCGGVEDAGGGARGAMQEARTVWRPLMPP